MLYDLFYCCSTFLIHCNLPPHQLEILKEKALQDDDVFKCNFTALVDVLPEGYVCTLEEELLPPSFRPSVQKLKDEGYVPKKKYERFDKRW